MGDIGKTLLGIFTGILALSIVSVIVSKRSQAPTVIQAAGTALSNVIAAAVNPVTNGVQGSNNGNIGLQSFTTPGLMSINPVTRTPLNIPNFGGY